MRKLLKSQANRRYKIHKTTNIDAKKQHYESIMRYQHTFPNIKIYFLNHSRLLVCLSMFLLLSSLPTNNQTNKHYFIFFTALTLLYSFLPLIQTSPKRHTYKHNHKFKDQLFNIFNSQSSSAKKKKKKKNTTITNYKLDMANRSEFSNPT